MINLYDSLFLQQRTKAYTELYYWVKSTLFKSEYGGRSVGVCQGYSVSTGPLSEALFLLNGK